MPIPLSVPRGLETPIHDAIEESGLYGFGEWHPISFLMRGVLSSSVVSDTDTYTVPRAYNLLVEEVIGHIAMNSLTAEILTAPAASVLAMSAAAGVRDRAAVKAQIVTMKLFNSDRGDLKVFGRDKNDNDGNTILPRLSSFYGPAFSRPWRLGLFPLVVQGGDTLSFTCATADATAMGSATECGVLLRGHLVSKNAG